MKKICFLTAIVCLLSSSHSFAQKTEKDSGFISTAGFSMGFFDNTKMLNNLLSEYYPEYKDFNPILQTGFTLGFGCYFKNRFSILTESFASSAPAITKSEKQYSELRSYGSKLKFSYVFLRHRRFDFEFSTGIGVQYNSFLHTMKYDSRSNKPELALNSMNTVIPLGITWWIYKNQKAAIGNNAVGVSIDYNIIARKGITTITGFSDDTNLPNISSNLLWLSVVLKM